MSNPGQLPGQPQQPGPTVSVRQRREAIAAALFARVDASTRRVVGLVTSSRVLRHYDQVDPGEMPALFQLQKPEKYEVGAAIGVPGKRTMMFEIWLMVPAAQADGVVPSQGLNNMVDAVEAALAPDDLVRQNCTLGGLVATARIDGSIEYYENVTNDGKSIAIITVAVLLP